VAAAERGKPVVAYKLGRSQQGAELALSHTGALAGEDDIAGAFLSDCGIARVENFEALLETLPLLGRVPAGTVRGRAPRVGVVTTTGGGAAMVVDGLALRGVDVTRPSDDTFARLQSAGVSVERGVLVDLTMAGTRPDVMKAALDVMLSAPEFDLVVAVTGSSARFRPELAVKPVIESASNDKPLVSFLAPDAPDALAMLSQANVPNFRTPEACADAIAAAFARRVAVAPVSITRSVRRNKSAQLNEHDAYALFARVGVPHASSVVLQVDASAIDLPFAYPVVVKLLSDTIAHKSDVGGVVLNVRDAFDCRVGAQGHSRCRCVASDRAADAVGARRVVAGLSQGCRCRPGGAARGRRHLHGDLSRSQHSSCAGDAENRGRNDFRTGHRENVARFSRPPER
jgi:acyl-CoA synthetase (NDP forming)